MLEKFSTYYVGLLDLTLLLGLVELHLDSENVFSTCRYAFNKTF